MVMKLPGPYKSESRRWRLIPVPDQFADKSPEHKKTRPKWAGFPGSAPTKLTLGVLRTLTRLPQTHFLTLDFTGVASDVTGFTQRAAQGFVVLDQSASDAVADVLKASGAKSRGEPTDAVMVRYQWISSPMRPPKEFKNLEKWAGS